MGKPIQSQKSIASFFTPSAAGLSERIHPFVSDMRVSKELNLFKSDMMQYRPHPQISKYNRGFSTLDIAGFGKRSSSSLSASSSFLNKSSRISPFSYIEEKPIFTGARFDRYTKQIPTVSRVRQFINKSTSHIKHRTKASVDLVRHVMRNVKTRKNIVSATSIGMNMEKLIRNAHRNRLWANVADGFNKSIRYISGLKKIGKF